MSLKTKRLILRQWQDSDLESFCQMCADPEVMRYFPSTLTRAESLQSAAKVRSSIDERGWGLWAVEAVGKAKFIGFVGLNSPAYELPFSPCIEIGWRLHNDYWGKGYATEAAEAALNYGFSELKLSEIVSFATLKNTASIKVMERLGMENTGFTFEHPGVPKDSNIRHHILYRMTKIDWEASR